MSNGTDPDGSASAADLLSSAQQNTFSQGNPGAVTSCPPKKHWIEIRLEDENGKPIPNESYVITDPANKQHTGSLDGQGFVRIDGLDPGVCTVSFPKLCERYRPSLVSANSPVQS